MTQQFRVLMTSGATREPIDQVRFITNFSSGRTGAEIAQSILESRDDAFVHYLAGEGAAIPQIAERCEVTRFESFSDLDSKLKLLLSTRDWDLVIHLAAVGDYSLSRIVTQSGRELPRNSEKLDSSEDLILELRRNFKIIGRIRSYARAPLQIVAFKLTNQADDLARDRAVFKLLEEDLDLVVHNDLAELRQSNRVFRAYGKKSRAVEFQAQSVGSLAQGILNWMRGVQ